MEIIIHQLYLENVIEIPFWSYLDTARIDQQAKRFKADLIRRAEKTGDD